MGRFSVILSYCCNNSEGKDIIVVNYGLPVLAPGRLCLSTTGGGDSKPAVWKNKDSD